MSDELAERLARLPEIRHWIYLAEPGLPAAQRFDAGGRGTRVWCWVHEQDQRACIRDGEGCDGVPLNHAADPTGETATNHDPTVRARRDLEKLTVHLRAGRTTAAIKILDRLIIDWLPQHTRDTADARLTLEGVNEPKCESCMRIGYDPPGERRRGDGGGCLDRTMTLCEWCRAFVRDVRKLPSRQQLRDHRDGNRVMRRVDA